jgi:hypothetical protein
MSLNPQSTRLLADRVRHGADPAERIDFAIPLAGPRPRFDSRSDAELRSVITGGPTVLERERALWELAERDCSDLVRLTGRVLDEEPDQVMRVHALWLLLQQLGSDSLDFLGRLTSAADLEVADWARLLISDLTGADHESVYGSARIAEDGAFDQTLPLIISGYVIVSVPGVGMVEARLSPLWFEAIMGRVMACTNADTIYTDLVVEKAVKGLHPDGSEHYELFKFSGMSGELAEDSLEHHYVSSMSRAFYPSLTVEHGHAVENVTELDRVAATKFAHPGEFDILGDGPRANRIAAAPRLPFVKSVRGRYFGWAAVNLDAVLAAGTVGAGMVQLSNPTSAVSKEATNARLYGLFRGKLSDHSGSGIAEMNIVPCHGTVDGEHDLHADGTCLPDPFLRLA